MSLGVVSRQHHLAARNSHSCPQPQHPPAASQPGVPSRTRGELRLLTECGVEAAHAVVCDAAARIHLHVPPPKQAACQRPVPAAR